VSKNGYSFNKIVDILIKCLNALGDYKTKVAKELIGVELVQGYKILKVIGVGNVGTTVLVEDLQTGSNAVLKIYHSKGAVTQGLREYNTLYSAQNAPSVVKLYNVMYSQSGSFIVLALEDLTNFETFYNICDTMKLSQS
jgi:serine/threonine protein kinase